MILNDTFEDKVQRDFEITSNANSGFGSVMKNDNEQNNSLIYTNGNRNTVSNKKCLLTRLLQTARILAGYCDEGLNSSIENANQSKYRKFYTTTEKQQSAMFNMRNLSDVQEENLDSKRPTDAAVSPDKALRSLIIRSRTQNEATHDSFVGQKVAYNNNNSMHVEQNKIPTNLTSVDGLHKLNQGMESSR